MQICSNLMSKFTAVVRQRKVIFTQAARTSTANVRRTWTI